MLTEPVQLHEYLTQVEVPQAPAMPIREGGCSYSHGNIDRVREHYDSILATVLTEPDGLLRIRKLFYLMTDARNQWPFCGWRIPELLPHILAVPATGEILTYLASFAASDLPGSIQAFVALRAYLTADEIRFPCPNCTAPQDSSFTPAPHACINCGTTIPEAHFKQSQWYKCTCGKLTHVSDSGFICTCCGRKETAKTLARANRAYTKRVIRDRIRQVVEEAGLPGTTLDELASLTEDPKRLEWLANLRV